MQKYVDLFEYSNRNRQRHRLDPAIHVFTASAKEDVDARDKPGHDGVQRTSSTNKKRERNP
jgi:hypothetical protein